MTPLTKVRISPALGVTNRAFAIDNVCRFSLAGPVVSFARKSAWIQDCATSSRKVRLSSLTTGGSFTGRAIMVTVCIRDNGPVGPLGGAPGPPWSSSWNVTIAGPNNKVLAFGASVNWTSVVVCLYLLAVFDRRINFGSKFHFLILSKLYSIKLLFKQFLVYQFLF